MYKIIAKTLANRLVVFVGSVICFEQFAFINGRQNFDGMFLMNEIVLWCNKV